jgi:hypothetical protein
MKKKQQGRRQSFYRHNVTTEIGLSPVHVWGYGPTGDFICRLGITSAGIAVYSGTKANKRLCNLTWEGFVDRLSRTP